MDPDWNSQLEMDSFQALPGRSTGWLVSSNRSTGATPTKGNTMYTHLFRPAKPMRTFTVGFQTFKTTNEVDFTSAVWLLFRPVQVDDARVYRSLDPPNAIEPPLNAPKARYFKSLRLCNECFLILPCSIREKNTAVGQHYTPFSRHHRPLLSTSTQRCRRLHQENTQQPGPVRNI